MNFNQIVRYSLEYSNQSRYYHWQTESYAHHEALGEFYDCFNDNVDKMVEAFELMTHEAMLLVVGFKKIPYLLFGRKLTIEFRHV